MKSFVNLHNHTEYSLLDGLCKVDDLIRAAVNEKMPAVAITDHGNLFGIVEFYNKAIKASIKPIIGIEAYVSKEPIDAKPVNGKRSAYNHLILLAKNMEGYKNLIKLSSIAYERGFYYKPRIDEQILEQYSKGIIGMSACLKGILPELLLNDKRKEAEEKAIQYKEIFNGDFYVELQDHGIDEEIIVKEQLIDLARGLDIPIAATNDGHYMKKEHADAHEVMLCIQTQNVLSDPKRFRISTHELYFKNRAEMEQLFGDVPEALDNTLKIANKCNVLFDFSARHLPKFTIPEEHSEKGADKYLTYLTERGLAKRYDKITPEIEERLEYELSIIHKMKFSDYFLVVNDFIEFARKKNIPIGPGRGSAAGSLVSYALGITNLDPLKYDLIFERFLNPDRKSMPDIDIDFCVDGREDVINYVREEYGNDSVTQIITFGTMGAKAVVRDVGRAMEIPYDDVNRIAKMIPTTINIKLKDAISSTPELREVIESNPVYKKMIEYAEVLEGMVRHASVHAAGIVIAPEPLTNFLPLYRVPKTGETTTQFTMNFIESMGLLKMDFLGLRTLTVIHDAVNMINNNGGSIDIEQIPLTDKKTYKLFSNGDTTGVFQFESAGMKDYLRKLQPECVEDLIAMNALYRPGPLGKNMVDDFIQRKHGQKKIEYMHPMLEQILKETYGVIVYQEQVMRIAGNLGGFTLAQADDLRKAMGKKKLDLMRDYKEIFIEGALKNDIPKETADEIYEHIAAFAGYGFNKSHSACYAIVAYQTAYLKVHYPAEFMAASLSSEMMHPDRIVILLEECRQMGLNVLPPDILKSDLKFTVNEKGIQFGLGAVKNVGHAAIDSLLQEREQYKTAGNFYEFCEYIDTRTINKKVLESLIMAGALDVLEGTRAQKFEVIEIALNYAQSAQSEREKGQTNLFIVDGDEDQQLMQEYPPFPDVEEWTRYEMLAKEKEMLGFYISGHPLNKYKDEVEGLSINRIEDIKGLKENAATRNGGIITAVKVIQTKKDASMAFITLEDFSGSIEVVVFPDVYSQFKSMIKMDTMVFVLGRISRKEEDNTKILADEIIRIEEAREKFTKNVLISLTAQGLETTAIDSINNIVSKSPGKCGLYINVKTILNENVRMKSSKYMINPDTKTIKSLRKLLGQDSVKIAGLRNHNQ